jgi:hypothetical protein
VPTLKNKTDKRKTRNAKSQRTQRRCPRNPLPM